MKYLVMAIIEADGPESIKFPEGTLANTNVPYPNWGEVQRDTTLDTLMAALESWCAVQEMGSGG